MFVHAFRFPVGKSLVLSPVHAIALSLANQGVVHVVKPPGTRLICAVTELHATYC